MCPSARTGLELWRHAISYPVVKDEGLREAQTLLSTASSARGGRKVPRPAVAALRMTSS
jgi:hypothetical protein